MPCWSSKLICCDRLWPGQGEGEVSVYYPRLGGVAGSYSLCFALPPNDHDFSLRWRLVKQGFSKALPTHEYRSDVRINRGERGIWQRRYWEHLIRDEADFNAHLDYVHINPLKHGLVQRVIDWPYSTFHRYYQHGRYPADWCDGGLSLPEYTE